MDTVRYIIQLLQFGNIYGHMSVIAFDMQEIHIRVSVRKWTVDYRGKWRHLLETIENVVHRVVPRLTNGILFNLSAKVRSRDVFANCEKKLNGEMSQ